MNGTTICGIEVPPSEPILANDLFECDEYFPNEYVSWNVGEMDDIKYYYIFLGALGWPVTFFNLAILLGIMRDPKLRCKHHNLQIAGQAVADLSVGMLILVFLAVPAFNSWEFTFQHVGCGIFGLGIVLTCQTTVFSLAWIAYNRRKQVLLNKHTTSSRLVKEYVFGVWGVNVVFGIYYSLVTRFRMTASGSYCNPIYNYPTLLPLGSAFMSGIAYVIWVYYHINCLMQKTSTAVQAKKKSGQVDESISVRMVACFKHYLVRANPKLAAKSVYAMCTMSAKVHETSFAQVEVNSRYTNSVIKKRIVSPKEKAKKAQAKVTRLMVIMCAAILVCWIPLYIYMLFVIINVTTGSMPPGLYYAEMMLGFGAGFSSLCSPIIYGTGNKSISKAMCFAFMPTKWKEAYEESHWENTPPSRALIEIITRKLFGNKNDISLDTVHIKVPDSIDCSGFSANTGENL